MADLLHKVVAASGGDYTSLEACMNANEQDLVTNNKYFEVEISGSWANADVTPVVIENYTTDATHYIRIYTNASARHSGSWSPDRYRLEITGNYDGISCVAAAFFVRIEGLQIKHINVFNKKALIFNPNATSEIRVSHNIIRGDFSSANDYCYGIYMKYFGTTYKVWNNIVYDFVNAAKTNVYGIYRSDGNCYIYNNTVHNCYVGVHNATINRISTFKNNIANDCVNECFDNVTNYTADCTRNVGNKLASELTFGVVADSGTTDGAGKDALIDDGQNFLTTVVVGMVIKNTTDDTYTYVTAVNSDSTLSVNDDIFASGEAYTIYENMFGAVTFKDEGADNFHLDSSDTVATSKWNNVYADGNIAVTDDIDGNARPNDDTGDIGADEYVAVGPEEKTKTITSDAHFWNEITRTIASDANLYAEKTKTITSDSHFWSEAIKTILSDSHLWNELTKLINSNSHLWNELTKTILSNAELYSEVEKTKTILSLAVLWNELTKTTTSDANIYNEFTKTILSDAILFDVFTKTINSDSHLWNELTKIINSDTHIWNELTKTILSDAELTAVSTLVKTIFSNAFLYRVGEVFDVKRSKVIADKRLATIFDEEVNVITGGGGEDSPIITIWSENG